MGGRTVSMLGGHLTAPDSPTMRMRPERLQRSGMARLRGRRRPPGTGATAGAGPRQGAASALPGLRILVPFIRPHWRGFVPPILAVIATSFVALIEPWPLKFLIDNVLHVGQGGEAQGSPEIIPAIAGAIVALSGFPGALGFLRN